MKQIVAYAAGIGMAGAVFLLIRSAGEPIEPAVSAPAAAAGTAHTNALFQLLLALAVIIVTARLVGQLFRLLDQPLVIGELVGGLILGPSFLGRVAPDLSAALLPPDITPFLNVHAQLGVILYMFLVGLELDLAAVRQRGPATLAIAHAGIVVPFLLGSALALALFPGHAGGGVRFTVFALFIGVSLSVTAFPVLARILTDRGISRSPMGTLALTCAAVADATAWCLLAMVVSIAQAQARAAFLTVGLTVAFVVLVLKVAMPIVHRRLVRDDQAPAMTPGGRLSVVLVAVLASAVAAEYIGIHALFGAFLFGAIIPSSSRMASELRSRLEGLVSVLFLPVFFAFTGMRTEIGAIGSLAGWLVCGAVVATAIAGKFGGTLIASRLAGLGWRDSAALGVLMNTRGLVELIVLNIGLDLGIISRELFAMLVVMALVTTFMASPLLRWLLKEHPWVELDARAVAPAMQAKNV